MSITVSSKPGQIFAPFGLGFGLKQNKIRGKKDRSLSPENNHDIVGIAVIEMYKADKSQTCSTRPNIIMRPNLNM